MIILSSPSGAGKTSICKKLLEKDNKIVMSISYTTRKKRKSEKEGVDYFFVSKKKFKELIEMNFFIEYANVFDNWYGTPKSFVSDNLNNGVDVMNEEMEREIKKSPTEYSWEYKKFRRLLSVPQDIYKD